MSIIRAGALDRRVLIERPVTTVTPEGEWRREEWEPVAEVPASIRYLRAQERVQAPKPMPVESLSIWIRYRQVEPTWRVVLDGRPYRITGIAVLGRREGVEITAERIEV